MSHGVLPFDLARLRRINPILLASMVVLIAVGVAFVYSACSIREEASLHRLYLQHAQLGLAGLGLYLALAYADFRLAVRLGWLVYAVSLILLVAVLLVGDVRLGARRWVFGIQPSEIAKIATILVLAQYLGRREASGSWREFVVALLIVALPAALVLHQPDLGTALVFAPVCLAMLFAAGTAPRALLAAVLLAVLLAASVLGTLVLLERKDLRPAWRPPLERSLSFLDGYQRRRLLVYLFPERDPHGMAWNKRQSEIAVGSGGRWGKGFLKGDQNLLGYLPQQVSANDFVFSVLAEETGFAGSMGVLLLFLGILLPGLAVAAACRECSGRLLCVGVVTLVFSHVFVNIAMTVGLVPVTGVPLPFISYGRTFMLSMLVGLGLVQSVAVHGHRVASRFQT